MRARELRGEPRPKPRDNRIMADGLPTPTEPDRFIPSLPMFRTADCAYVLPGNLPTTGLLRERYEATSAVRASDRIRYETDATIPADMPRKLLHDTADALLRWGVAAANYQRKTTEWAGKLDEMAAEIATSMLAGPEQLLTDLRRADRRIAAVGEESASFSSRWKRDRLAVALIACAPGAERNPETLNPFQAWDPDFNAKPKSFDSLCASK
jgi:hypothetical protein